MHLRDRLRSLGDRRTTRTLPRAGRSIPSCSSRRGLPLAIAALELPDRAQVIDLDDPAVLTTHELDRLASQRGVERSHSRRRCGLYRRHRFAAGLRWWSVFESLWANFTIFDRAERRVGLAAVRALEVEDPAVAEAADLLGPRSAVAPRPRRFSSCCAATARKPPAREPATGALTNATPNAVTADSADYIAILTK